MKVLQLYNGSKTEDSVFKKFGLDSVSCELAVFDYCV